MLREHDAAWDLVELGKAAFYDPEVPFAVRVSRVMRGMLAIDFASTLCSSRVFPVVRLEPLPQPHTLTGDEWRTAWADAHDAETDKALDAVY